MRLILLFILVISLHSCLMVESYQAANKAIGKSIIMPSINEIYSNGVDVKIGVIDSLSSKLIVYFEENQCSTCKIPFLRLWNNIAKLSTYTQGRFDVIFVFSPNYKDIAEVRRAIISNKGTNGLVLLDIDNKFKELNPHIPKNNRYHTFLLDKDNKIVLVGDPLDNEKLWELYKKEISRLCRD